MMSAVANAKAASAPRSINRRCMVFSSQYAERVGGYSAANVPPAPIAVNIVMSACLVRLNEGRDYELYWRTPQGRPDRPGSDPGATRRRHRHQGLHQPGGAQPDQPVTAAPALAG